MNSARYVAIDDKYAIRKHKQSPNKRKRLKLGRFSVYNQPAIINVIRTIWFVTDQMRGKRLVVAISEWLPFYEKAYCALEPDISVIPPKNKLS